jgi:hypothetical protein
MGLTGNRDVDMEIILQLEDRELPAVCSVNKYVNEICSSDAFWYRRLINRITKAREDNLSKYKKLIIIDITGERIRQMQHFFGLKTLKELNDLLNMISFNATYQIYYDFPTIDENINNAYDIKELPEYINEETFRYYLRREAIKVQYSRLTGKKIPYPTIHFNLIPKKRQWRQEIYDILRITGIK